MYQVQDLTSINWGVSRANGASYGCYMKGTRIENGIKYYYKLSNYNSAQGFIGEESVYEVISSRFLRKLGFNCAEYKLIKCKVRVNGVFYITYACKSRDFSRGYDSRTSFELLREMYMQYSVEDFITRFGFADGIRKQIVADFMLIGRDRHGGNIEVLYKNGKFVLAPIFDNGLSLLAPIPLCLSDNKKRVLEFDSLGDFRVNNYIGTQSLYQNLRYVNKPLHVRKLIREDRGAIFYNMSSVLPKYYLDKCWEILTYRYSFLRKRGFIIDD